MSSTGKRKDPPSEQPCWTWHVLLFRSRYYFEPSDKKNDKVICVDVSGKQLTTGWFLEVYRLKESEEAVKNETKIFPLEIAKDLMKQDEDIAQVVSEATGEKDAVRACTESPCGAHCLMELTQRKILAWLLFEDWQGFPQLFFKDALQCLRDAQTDFKPDYLSKDREGNVIDSCMGRSAGAEGPPGFTKETWKEIVSERPSRINVYVPGELKNQVRDELEAIACQLFPQDTCRVQVGPKSYGCNSGDSWVPRLLWNLELSARLVFRTKEVDEEAEQSKRGWRDMKTTGYWLRGENIQNLPRKDQLFRKEEDAEALSKADEARRLEYDNVFCHYEMAYIRAGHLLSLRPWKTFAPFEALKVTWRRRFKEDVVRWVHFCSDVSGGDGRSESSIGWMEIFESLAEFKSRFGRTNLGIQSGLIAWDAPDRLIVSAEETNQVHYDSIFLLEHLFDGSLHHPAVDLPPGIVTLLQVETGPPPSYPDSSRPRGVRPMTNKELEWVEHCLSGIYQFVKEEGPRCKPSEGNFTRSYSGSEGGDSITVSYNMDITHGGIWNSDTKWMWFS